jgi:ATP-dependent RNA helicase DeaD
VINVDFPGGAETYVHRIGRTGRAGAAGTAITMVTPAERRKLKGLERTLNQAIEEMMPPSPRELALAQQAALWQTLETTRTESDLTEVKKWLEARRNESGVQPKDIAAAAVKILIEQQGIQLNPPPEAPPGKRGDGPPRDRDDLARVNEVEIVLSMGRYGGLRPQDVVGALANEAGIRGTEIGRISLFDKKCFVGLPRQLAERILDDLPVLMIRGSEVHLSLAKPRSHGERPPRRKHTHKPKHKHKHKRPSRKKQGGFSPPKRRNRKK